MSAVARDQDTNDHGAGEIQATASTVFVNGKPIATVGDPAAPDGLCPIIGGAHCAPSTSTGAATVFAEGRAVHRVGDLRTCGAETDTGSPDVFCHN
jgi:uncharacterized Zn-binding protein involved in type VI secretion